MKKLLLLLLIFNSSYSIAQQKQWQRIGIDSSDFCKIYGSEFEYNFEYDQMRKSSHKHLVVMIGAKSYWVNELSLYIQDNGWAYNDDLYKEGSNYQKFVFNPNISTTKIIPKLTMTSWLNTKDRVTSISITGPADDIINLFVNYWELSVVSLDDLKRNNTVFQSFASDKIVFSWKEVNPKITITRSVNPLIIPQQ